MLDAAKIAALGLGMALLTAQAVCAHTVLRYRAALEAGFATMLYEPDESSGGPRLTYFITLNGLDLDGSRTPGVEEDDVVAVRFRLGGSGVKGPHALNVFGSVGGEPRQDDNNMFVNATISELAGIWDGADERFTGEGETRLPIDSVGLPAVASDLLAQRIYLEVLTVGFPAGELRGQVVPEASEVSVKRLANGGFQMTFNVFSPRIIRIEAGDEPGDWEFLNDLVVQSSVARTVDFGAADRDRRFYRLSELILAHPKILAQPVGRTVDAGQPAGFEVLAEGTPQPAFQWYHNGDALEGANEPGLLLETVQQENAGEYRVAVSSFVGTVYSEAVTLTVNP